MIKEVMDRLRLISAIGDLATVNSDNTKDKNDFFYNLSLNSLFYVDIIRFYDKITISKIANLIGVSKSAVTIKMAELEKKGYIIKEQDVEDKRVKYLRLSKNMQQVYDSFDDKELQVIVEINEKFSRNQINSFCEIGNFMCDRIQEEEGVDI